VLFALPALALSGAVVLVPALLTLVIAFTEWDGVAAPSYVGLDNFRDLFGDVIFWRAIMNNLQWVVIFLTIPMALALTSSAILAGRTRSASVWQAIFLIPYVISPIANAGIWSMMIFDRVGGLTGVIDRSMFPLANPLGRVSTALYTVAAVDIWHFWGYLTIVFVAAMRQIPADQLEAATLEGAGFWQVFRYVILPNIWPTIALMVVLVTIFSFLTFDYVYLMTGGGPAHATELLSTLAYGFAFRTFEIGKAAAVSMTMSLFGLAAALAYIGLARESLKR
jgi:raffinose/stachyose/melibiose transport system permease protein